MTHRDLQPKEKADVLSVLLLYGINYRKLKIKKDNIGFVNKTYFISTGNKKLVLRKSNPTTSFKHLKLEVDLLNYLQKKNFKLTAQILPNLKDKLITNYHNSYFTLQKFLPGKIRASWNNLKNFNKNRLASLLQTTAKFSLAVKNFPVHPGAEPALSFYVENSNRLFKKSFNNIPPSVGKRLLKNKFNALLEVIQIITDDFKKVQYNKLSKQIVHFDLHPGNVHYQKNKVVAMFDFDWVRYDSRISDIAAAIGQSCYYFSDKNTGKYRKDYIQYGLRSYRKIYKDSTLPLAQENELIKVGLKGFMFFQLLWAMDLYADNPSKNNFIILNHFINVLLVNDYNWLFS